MGFPRNSADGQSHAQKQVSERRYDMSRTYHHGERRIRVRGVKKDPPDLRRIARALIELARAEAEAAAQAEATIKTYSTPKPSEQPPTTESAAVNPEPDDREVA
jgi:hypothetical protein